MINIYVYRLTNWVFAGLFALIFIYSGIYSTNQQYPVKCYYQTHYKKACPTCGMSRGFSAIMRGKFIDAKRFNNNLIPVFCFFSIQLLLRLTVNFLLIKVNNAKSAKLILTTDILLSTVLFSWAFHNIILSVISMDKFQ